MANVNFFSPDGGTTRYPIEDTEARSRIAGQQSLIKDTVGWTGKNKYNDNDPVVLVKSTKRIHEGNKFEAQQGDELTLSFDISAVANFDLSSGVNAKIIDDTNTDVSAAFDFGREEGHVKHTFKITGTPNGLVRVYFFLWSAETSGTATATLSNIMVYDATINDDTYEPYHESVEVMYEEEIHGVNLLENKVTSQTVNGVTFTVNADGSVKVNGTASSNVNVDIYSVADAFRPPIGRYIISRGGATRSNVQLFVNKYNGTNRVSQVTNLLGTNEFEFDVDYDGYDRLHIGLWVDNGTTVSNLMLYPMIRKADIEDNTYRPYNPQAIQNQLNAQGVLGAKNLLENVGSTITQSGITATYNSDGSILLNGTATANIGLMVSKDVSNNNFLPNGKYILSGSAVFSDNCYLWMNKYVSGSGSSLVQLRTSGEVEFAIDTSQYDGIKVGITVRNGTTLSNFLVKPMIRLASDPDDTYVPYAMTNRELTEKVFEKRILSSADDLNNITETGIYAVRDSTPANTPEGHNWGSLLVNKVNTNNIQQQFFKAELLYQRAYRGTTPAWTSWYKFTGTVVS